MGASHGMKDERNAVVLEDVQLVADPCIADAVCRDVVDQREPDLATIAEAALDDSWWPDRRRRALNT